MRVQIVKAETETILSRLRVLGAGRLRGPAVPHFFFVIVKSANGSKIDDCAIVLPIAK